MMMGINVPLIIVQLLLVRLVLRAVTGCAGRGAEATERHMSLGMDGKRQLLSAQRQRAVVSRNFQQVINV
jgi:hypothetical protein